MRRMTRDARLNASDLIRPACRRCTIMCMSYSSKTVNTFLHTLILVPYCNCKRSMYMGIEYLYVQLTTGIC